MTMMAPAPSRAGHVLRPYQRAAIDATFAWVREHPGHPLIVIPTGGGKSLVMGTLIAEVLTTQPGARALLLAHRKELLQQNVRAVASCLPLARIGLYSAALNRKDRDVDVLVAGIHSFAKKPMIAGGFDVVLIDEAHLVPTSEGTMYRQTIDALLRLNPRTVFIGLTATPYRLDSGFLHRGEGALFTDIAFEASVTDLIADGYLCPLVARGTATKLDVAGVGTRGGEFIPGQLAAAVDRAELTEAIVREVCLHAEDRHHWVFFGTSVEHVQHIAQALRELGIPAAAIHGQLSPLDRAERLEAFHEGTLRALASVEVLTTGWDEPAVDLIALLRPTKSPGLYQQMVGRGLRLHPSKADTLVLDFAGNVARHGPIDAVIVRDKTKGEGEAPVKECPECRLYNPAGAATCSGCGFAFPPPEPAPLAPEPSVLPILSTEIPPATWHEVTDVWYTRHEKEGKTPSLRVDYIRGFRTVASEWVCLAHEGFARRKAEHWWRTRAGLAHPVPTSIDEARELAELLPKPVAIATRPDGKYTRVVEVRFAEDAVLELPLGDETAQPPAAAATPCAGCDFFVAAQGFCLAWSATVPEAHQATGCGKFTPAQDLPF